ncbi:MAG: YkgJ family cysteine cluster protein [Deltaproteobacteria bacterium]|nr:YkgJ family cysteine cluster protein [Deltaproteobacteria bacterium]MBW2010851.1 YkgJ family cysteine cluster protein [Deltaproteobacteria bacterium]MBW2099499.1 YkgJ family cysteine cluster protein [Deltaproteobacteria bacterium]
MIKDQLPYKDVQSDDDDYLFNMAKNIAVKIILEGRTRSKALELCEKILGFGDHILKSFESKEPKYAQIACRTGCHFCCFAQVSLTPPEALLIGNYVETFYTETEKRDLMKQVEKNLKLTHGKSLEQRVKVWYDTPCIFLKNKKCTVYEVRPFICRAWHSLSVDQCKKAFNDRNPSAEIDSYPHRNYILGSIRAGLQQGCMDMGCQADTLEIAKAVKLFFNHQDPVKTWIKGEKVF